MQFFGTPYNEYTSILPKIEEPAGECCVWCDEPILPGDCGFILPVCGEEKGVYSIYHKNCFLRTIVGSVGHQQGQCSCFGGAIEDPPELTKREAADAAAELFHRRNPNE